MRSLTEDCTARRARERVQRGASDENDRFEEYIARYREENQGERFILGLMT